MTKRELVAALAPFRDDVDVIIHVNDGPGGTVWNIHTVDIDIHRGAAVVEMGEHQLG